MLSVNFPPRHSAWRLARRWHGPGLLALLLVLTGCVQNPVTGEQELGWVDTGQELAVGAEQYGPSQQMQGGIYVVDPELNTYVQQVGQRVAVVSDRDLPYEFVVLNNSVPNAWALPGGKIAVNRGLLVELESEAELAAVLGHEVTHAAARHGAKAMERGMLLQGAVMATALGTADSDYAWLAVGSAQIGAALITTRYGRDAERESDYYGMQYMRRAGYDPAAAISLQEKFLALSKGATPTGFQALFSSHPPSAERVMNNRETLAELPPGPDGILGADSYAAATAALRRRQPAYDAYEAGRIALAKGDLAAAQARVNEALAIEPRESRFHGLAGDIAQARGDTQAALAAHERALALNPEYYEHQHDVGLALLALGRRDQARGYLQRSVDLLPTADALNALGQLALADGRRDAATSYLEAAAKSNSPSGAEARLSLARLELAQAPGKYVSSAWGVDSDAHLLVEVRNEAPLDVTGVVLEVRLRLPDGNVTSRQYDFGTLAAGAAQRRTLELRMVEGMNDTDVALGVVAARPLP